MKVKVSFELDLSSNPSLNAKKLEHLRGSLQNLSSFFRELHLSNQDKLTDVMFRTDLGDKTKKASIKICKANCATSAQLFNNYKVEGVTDDGHTFVTTHQEPGYRETMLIDGKETAEY